MPLLFRFFYKLAIVCVSALLARGYLDYVLVALFVACPLSMVAQTIPFDWLSHSSQGSVESGGTRSMATDGEGNIYVTGKHTGPASFGEHALMGAGRDAMFLVKWDRHGRAAWAREAVGGDSRASSLGVSVCVDRVGNVFVLSYLRAPVTLGAFSFTNRNDLSFLVSYDREGAVRWARAYGRCYPVSLDMNSDGEMVIAGRLPRGVTTVGDSSLADTEQGGTFVAKLSPTGDVMWARRAGSSAEDSGEPGIARFDSQDNVYLIAQCSGAAAFGTIQLENPTSSSYKRPVVASYTSDGVPTRAWNLFEQVYESGQISEFQATEEGGFVVMGSFNGQVTIGGRTLFISPGKPGAFAAKLTKDAKVSWLHKVGGDAGIYPGGLDYDVAGNTYLTGLYYSDGIWSLDQLTLTQTWPDLNGTRMFVCKIGPTGKPGWVYGAQAGPEGWEIAGIDVVSDQATNTWVTGHFVGSVPLGAVTLTASNHSVFVFKGPRAASAIGVQPGDQTVKVGEPARFDVTALGEAPLHYQWFFNGLPLPGATNECLKLASATHADAGFYSVRVSNSVSSLISRPARLTFTFLSLQLYAGLLLDGLPGERFRIEYTETPQDASTWQPLTNITVGSSPFFAVDPQPASKRMRYYRGIPLP